MAINLRWSSNIKSADEIKIYRSTSTFTSTNLPAVVATVEPDVTYYTDTTALLGVPYFYMLGYVIGEDVYYTSCVRQEQTIVDPWGTAAESLVLGDTNFGYGNNFSPLEFEDNVIYEILSRLGVPEYNDMLCRVCINGRYYITTNIPVRVYTAQAIANNMMLGHRTPALHATPAAAQRLGNNDEFIWRGRRWSVGFPKLFTQPNETTPPTNLTAYFGDPNGRLPAHLVCKSEALAMVIYHVANLDNRRYPRFRRSTYAMGSGSCEIMTCDTNPASSSSNIISYYNNSFSSSTNTLNSNTTTVNVSGNCYTFPLIEYKGVA